MVSLFHQQKSGEMTKMDQKIANLEGKLIVSCQALPEEPLHSSFIMGRMALAAKIGGACGIRANTKEDIREIQSQVDLPVIGIVKRDYADSEVYITPTMKEIEELMEVRPEIIAMDATISKRPGNKTLEEFFHEVKERYPDQLWMADCSTVEEALHADELGFDFIGTTMVGYTEQSKGSKIEADDFAARAVGWQKAHDRRREYQYTGKSEACDRAGSLQRCGGLDHHKATADHEIIC